MSVYDRVQYRIYQQFIEACVFNKLTPNQRLACVLLSMVRFFDTVMAQHILMAWDETQPRKRFVNWSHDQFSDLLDGLKRTLLIRFERGRGYVIEPVLKNFTRDYYANSQPEAFIAINQAALTLYSKWLDSENIENRTSLLLEEIYHLACLQRRNILATFKKRLEQYPHSMGNQEFQRDPLEQLKEELEYDEELAKVANTRKLIENVMKYRSNIKN